MNDEPTTIDENPYRSPLAVEQEASRAEYPSAIKAFWAGAKRGAKFGGKWVGLVLGGLVMFMCVIVGAATAYIAYRYGYDERELLENLNLVGNQFWRLPFGRLSPPWLVR